MSEEGLQRSRLAIVFTAQMSHLWCNTVQGIKPYLVIRVTQYVYNVARDCVLFGFFLGKIMPLQFLEGVVHLAKFLAVFTAEEEAQAPAAAPDRVV